MYLTELKRILGLCQQITGAVPVSATSREEVADAVVKVMKPELSELFGVRDVCITFCDEEETEEETGNCMRALRWCTTFNYPTGR